MTFKVSAVSVFDDNCLTFYALHNTILPRNLVNLFL